MPKSTPPISVTARGEPRRIGVEIEFADVSVRDSAALIERLFGGTQAAESAHRATVEDTRFGDFTVELDWQGAHKKHMPEAGTDPRTEFQFAAALEDDTRTLVADAVSGLVPTEIVSPPIPWDQLDALTPLFDGLRDAGAAGSEASLLYGFGLHLNPEVAEETADYALRHLQAYIVLEDWLCDRIDIDFTRRMLPHIDPFPEAYCRHVLAAGYQPDTERLIRDYLAHNPTRNRGLDMTPLFRHLDEATLLGSLEQADLVKARPTFHYRLPNAQLSTPGWDAVVEWERWLEVERLADDDEALAARRAEYLSWLDKPGPERWLAQVKRWFD